MKRTRNALVSSLATLLATLGLTGAVWAAPTLQDEDPPDSTGGGTTRTGKPAPRSQVPVSIRIEGLTAEALPGLLDALREMRHEVFECPACHVRERKAGSCERCSKELEEKPASQVVARAAASVDRTTLSITLHPHHWGSLNEMDALLGKSGARVLRDEFRLPEHARLGVTGIDPAHGARLRGALIDLEVFSSVSIAPRKDGDGVWILPRYEERTPVTVAAVAAALGKMRGEYVLADVQWNAYCPTCGVSSAKDMATFPGRVGHTLGDK